MRKITMAMIALFISSLAMAGENVNSGSVDDNESDIRLSLLDEAGSDMLADQAKSQTKRSGQAVASSKKKATAGKNNDRFDQNNTIYGNWRELAVSYLFDKYKRAAGVRVSEIESKDNFYKNLIVTDNARIMEEIIQAVEKDAGNAYNKVHQYEENGENTVLNIWIRGNSWNIGFRNKDGKSGSVFIQTVNPAGI